MITSPKTFPIGNSLSSLLMNEFFPLKFTFRYHRLQKLVLTFSTSNTRKCCVGLSKELGLSGKK